MTTMTQAHALADLSPDLTAAYSHQWLRRHGTGRKEGLVLDSVYRVRAGSKLAEHYGDGALVIGSPYAAHEGDTDVSGVHVMEVLCHGADASRVCLAGALDSLEEVTDFWTRYQRIGRCAIDVEHKTSFVHGVRYDTAGEVETCMWCGHQRRTTN